MQEIKNAANGRRRDVASSQYKRKLLAPAAAYLNMLFVDHGIFRVAYPNLHRLGNSAWRSSQPAPHHIRALSRRGIRTIVNLRGERRCGSYSLEQAACGRHGIELVNFHVRARRAPYPQEIKASIALFDLVQYPMLMHCKSGAERTGLMSLLYLWLKEGVPWPARAGSSPRDLAISAVARQVFSTSLSNSTWRTRSDNPCRSWIGLKARTIRRN